MQVVPITILVCLIFDLPSHAVSLHAYFTGDNSTDLVIGYDNNGSTTATRAGGFALKITAQHAVIRDISGYPRHGGHGYSFYPGSISLSPAGEVKDFGSPLEPDRPGTGRSALGTDQIIVVLCSNYDNPADTPPAAGELLTVKLDHVCVVEISPEVENRGGVVSEEGVTMATEPITVNGAAAENSRPAPLQIQPVLPFSRLYLRPAQCAVTANWLSATSVADFTGDTVCNLKDWAIACHRDFLSKATVWGRTESTYKSNLEIIIAEAQDRRLALPVTSKARWLAARKSWLCIKSLGSHFCTNVDELN
jgi:hypothetical protein